MGHGAPEATVGVFAGAGTLRLAGVPYVARCDIFRLMHTPRKRLGQWDAQAEGCQGYMIDHLDITVSDLARSETFYLRALAPLGVDLVYRNASNLTGGQTIGFSASANPTFCIRSGGRATSPLHIAFSATSRTAVNAFHAAALAAGGRDNGAPGLRPYYASNYYAAFVVDPDGHNVEAVCRSP